MFIVDKHLKSRAVVGGRTLVIDYKFERND